MPDFGNTPDTLERLAPTLEALRTRWSQLSPPASAQQLHQREALLLTLLMGVNLNLIPEMREQNSNAAFVDEIKGVQRLVAAEQAKFATDWNKLLIEALAR